MKYLIYGLVDPRTKLIHYIGRSSNALARSKCHRHKRALAANTRCATWIKSLLALELDYEAVALEQVASVGALNSAESWWIAYAHLSAWPLTNHTLGGEGMNGYSPSTESRKARSAKLKGRLFSAEHRARISAAKRGVPKTQEHRTKLSRAITITWQDEALREHQRLVHLGKRHEPEALAKIAAAHKGKKRSAKAVGNLSQGQLRFNRKLKEAGIPHPLTGKPRSSETRARISRALTERNKTPREQEPK